MAESQEDLARLFAEAKKRAPESQEDLARLFASAQRSEEQTSVQDTIAGAVLGATTLGGLRAPLMGALAGGGSLVDSAVENALNPPPSPEEAVRRRPLQKAYEAFQRTSKHWQDAEAEALRKAPHAFPVGDVAGTTAMLALAPQQAASKLMPLTAEIEKLATVVKGAPAALRALAGTVDTAALNAAIAGLRGGDVGEAVSSAGNLVGGLPVAGREAVRTGKRLVKALGKQGARVTGTGQKIYEGGKRLWKAIERTGEASPVPPPEPLPQGLPQAPPSPAMPAAPSAEALQESLRTQGYLPEEAAKVLQALRAEVAKRGIQRRGAEPEAPRAPGRQEGEGFTYRPEAERPFARGANPAIGEDLPQGSRDAFAIAERQTNRQEPAIPTLNSGPIGVRRPVASPSPITPRAPPVPEAPTVASEVIGFGGRKAAEAAVGAALNMVSPVRVPKRLVRAVVSRLSLSQIHNLMLKLGALEVRELPKNLGAEQAALAALED